MPPLRAATWAARLIGLLTLGWVYLSWYDLQWLLNLHKLHLRFPHSTFTFSYYPYLAATIAYFAAAVIAAIILLLFPACLIRILAPRSGKGRALGAFWFTGGFSLGLALVVLGIHTVLSTTCWTIYRSGQNAGWQLDIAVSAVVAIAGLILCRRVLTPQRADP